MQAGKLGLDNYRRQHNVKVFLAYLVNIVNKLLTQELLATLPDIHETEHIANPLCQIKLFTPDSNWTWYIIELSKSDNSTCYGYVQGLESELGYFTLDDISKIRGSLGLPVERDIFFEPTHLSTIIE